MDEGGGETFVSPVSETIINNNNYYEGDRDERTFVSERGRDFDSPVAADNSSDDDILDNASDDDDVSDDYSDDSSDDSSSYDDSSDSSDV